MFELALATTIDRHCFPTALTYPETVWGARRVVRTGEGTHPAVEPITPDTDIPLTVSQMAQAFDAIGTPTMQQDAGFSVDPDDYPLF